MRAIFFFAVFTVLLELAFARRLPNDQATSRAIRPSQGGRKVDLFKYRVDVETNKYIRLGSTDKCPENMRFFAVDGNETAGMCDCDYYQCSRTSLYSPETKKCHFAWSQGPCAEDEWYTFDEKLKPVCQKRSCPQGLAEEPVTAENVSLSYWFKSPKDGKCYEAGSAGDCEGEEETLLISPGEPIPQCRTVSVCVPLGKPEPQLCFPGNRRTYLRLCPEE